MGSRPHCSNVEVEEQIAEQLAVRWAPRRDEDVRHATVGRLPACLSIARCGWCVLTAGEKLVDVAEHAHVLAKRIHQCAVEPVQCAVSEVGGSISWRPGSGAGSVIASVPITTTR